MAQPQPQATLKIVDGKVTLTEGQWKQRLTPEQFQATRKNGTEKAFSGVYHNNKQPGTYTCICCGAELFSSSTNFDSGTGWPSFYQSITPNCVTVIKDTSHGMTREAVECSRCGAHLGHVFSDGPKPTGQRFCMNSVALNFIHQK